MRRILSIAIPVLAALVLAACSHHNANAPLSFVPADTPYVIANLEPLDADTRKALLQNVSTPATRALQVQDIRASADHLAKRGDTDTANLLRAFASSIDGKSYAQIASSMGIDPNGLFAVYGVGLSPVIRGQLSDPAKFHAYIKKLETAYGHSLEQSQLGDIKYQYVKLGHTGLQAIFATHQKQYVAAVLPADATTASLKLVLGAEHPKTSLATDGQLAKLADQNGYAPYLLGYVDTTRLPALLAGFKDPLLQAVMQHGTTASHRSDLLHELPEACKPGLARIAARVPRISFGYTQLKAKDQTWQVDLSLAPDIVQAFKDMGTAVPGLGQVERNAAVSVALALPIPTLRHFWLAQAEAVQGKPFLCPALAGLNKAFHNVQKSLPKTSLPPIDALRGLKVVIDHLDLDQLRQGRHRDVEARILIASTNPARLLTMAKALIPPLATWQVKPDGKPVALPPAISAKAQEPAWVAMNDKALAIGIGKTEEAAIGTMLAAPAAPAGSVSHTLISGAFYAHWMAALTESMTPANAPAGASSTDKAAHAALARAKAQLAASQALFKRINTVTFATHVTSTGIRVTGETRWK